MTQNSLDMVPEANFGNPTPPAPALPQEVRQVIARILHCWEALPHPGVGTNQICAALAPLWPRTAPVTADTRELWERAFDVYCNGMGDATSHERAAAVLAPVVAELNSLRSQVLRLERDAYLGDDDEKRALRAALASAKQEVERLKGVAINGAGAQAFKDLRADIDRLNAEVAVLEGQLAAAEKQLAAAQEELTTYRHAECAIVQQRLFGRFLEGGSPTPLLDSIKRMLDAARREGGAT